MLSDRDSKLLVPIIICGWTIPIVGLPSFLPAWLNDALSMMFIILGVLSFGLLIISRVHQNSNILKYMYLILFVGAVLALIAGAWLSPAETEIASQQKPDHKAIVKAPKPKRINKDVGTSQVKVERVPRVLPKNNVKTTETPTPIPHRVFTPRTPKELMDIAEKKTRRDAMKHKGTWIHVKGPVLDISEPAMAYFDITDITKRSSYIRVEVKIESPPHFLIPRNVNLYLKTNLWKKQVDKIERGDWLEAIGTVHQVYKINMDVIDGEIISVSGPNSRSKYIYYATNSL